MSPAEEHAAKLIAKLGKDEALNVTRRKIEDAPFLVNGNLPFWVDVLNTIVNNRVGAPVK